MMGWGNMMGYGYGGYGGMMIMPIIFGLGILLLGFYLFRRNSFQGNVARPVDQKVVLDILRERYARGEIDTLEYQSKKRDLDL